MNAEREAAIRARLAAATEDARLIAEVRLRSRLTVEQLTEDQRHLLRLLGAESADLAYLLALVDRQATALDAVRELAEQVARIHNTERERAIAGRAFPEAVDFLRRLHDDLRAALAAADDDGPSCDHDWAETTEYGDPSRRYTCAHCTTTRTEPRHTQEDTRP